MSASPSALLSIIRPMREDDLDRVSTIETRSYDFPWNAGIFRDCLRMGYDCAVQVVDDQVVGYLIMSFGGGEAHVLNVAIEPGHQGGGYGRRLLRRAIRQAGRLGSDSIVLEVRPSNDKALRLYYSLGFKMVGRRRDYYPTSDGREDALVLRMLVSKPASGRH